MPLAWGAALLLINGNAAKGGKVPTSRKKNNNKEDRDNTMERARTKRSLSANRGTDGLGQGLAEALDVGFVFGFYHDAGELLGSGITKNDAAVFAES